MRTKYFRLTLQNACIFVLEHKLFLEAHICSQLVPRSPFFFGTDNVLHLEIVIDSLSMGGCWIDVTPFVGFPLLQHGVRSEIPIRNW